MLAQDGKMLLRLVDGSLSAFGPETRADKEAIEVDVKEKHVLSVLPLYDGPIVKEPRFIQETIQAARAAKRAHLF